MFLLCVFHSSRALNKETGIENAAREVAKEIRIDRKLLERAALFLPKCLGTFDVAALSFWWRFSEFTHLDTLVDARWECFAVHFALSKKRVFGVFLICYPTARFLILSQPVRAQTDSHVASGSYTTRNGKSNQVGYLEPKL